MPRPPNLIPSRSLHVRLPEDLLGRLDLELFSSLEGRVPYGAHQTFLVARLREFFLWKSLDLAPLGFPPGYFIRGPKEMVAAIERKLKGDKHG